MSIRCKLGCHSYVKAWCGCKPDSLHLCYFYVCKRCGKSYMEIDNLFGVNFAKKAGLNMFVTMDGDINNLVKFGYYSSEQWEKLKVNFKHYDVNANLRKWGLKR